MNQGPTPRKATAENGLSPGKQAMVRSHMRAERNRVKEAATTAAFDEMLASRSAVRSGKDAVAPQSLIGLVSPPKSDDGSDDGDCEPGRSPARRHGSRSRSGSPIVKATYADLVAAKQRLLKERNDVERAYRKRLEAQADEAAAADAAHAEALAAWEVERSALMAQVASQQARVAELGTLLLPACCCYVCAWMMCVDDVWMCVCRCVCVCVCARVLLLLLMSLACGGVRMSDRQHIHCFRRHHCTQRRTWLQETRRSSPFWRATERFRRRRVARLRCTWPWKPT